jgi:hypothetical protein
MADMPNYPFHPAADFFPRHTPEQFADLCASVQRHGWDASHPIVLCDGKIVDGRHRFLACKALNVTPTFTEYAGNPYDNAWMPTYGQKDIVRRIEGLQAQA